jgi:Trk K+ transport system NAD-binding subunit
MFGSKKTVIVHEDVTSEEFLRILGKGEIKLKQFVVGEHSPLDGIPLRHTNLPRDVLIGPLIRKECVILPDGNTILEKDDIIILIGKEEDINDTRNQLASVSVVGRVLNTVTTIFRKLFTRR